MGRGSKIRQYTAGLLLKIKSRPRSKALALISLAVAASVWFWLCLPEPLFKESYSTVIFDREGRLLGARIAGDRQWRFPHSAVPPDKYKAAVVQFEDRRFAYHPGLDPLALIRALTANLRAGHVVSGGSTLTMQTIRLSRGNPGRTVFEKLKEAALALRFELSYSKEEILGLYSSHAPFGGNIVGLEAASWRYFGRSPHDLSWAESALLAVLPNSPALIHPGKNRLLLKQKRDRLLVRLKEKGLLSEMDLKLSVLEPLPEGTREFPSLAPHLLDTLQAQAPGKRINTTLLAEKQRALSKVLAAGSQSLCRMRICNAAAIIIDNRNFEVVAYVGNSMYNNDDPVGAYMVDIVRRPRSTGSILKPFLFAAMLQGGEILPGTLVPDIPTNYKGFVPENFDKSHRGAVRAKEAIERSLNVPSVRMLDRYGVERFHRFLINMDMSTLHRAAEDYGLTLVLGGAEGTLFEIASLYANLAYIAREPMGGSPALYKQATVVSGAGSASSNRSDLGRGAAWLTLEALVEVTRPESEMFWRQFGTQRKIAWKTGTSFGQRDGWAVGTDASYTVGIWVGNADGTGVAGLTGVGSAAPLLFEAFNLLESSPWFPIPYESLKQVAVCKDDGYLANADCEAEMQWAPRESHFDKITPYHKLVHLDPSGRFRADGNCMQVSKLVPRSFFILPPAIEYYYRQYNPTYETLPPVKKGCAGLNQSGEATNPLGIVYPEEGTRVYIPVDLDGKLGSVIFSAVHRDPEMTMYWHLDDQYMGDTKTFHKKSMSPKPGPHRLTLVDTEGNTLARDFIVLSKDSEHNK